VPDGHTPLRVLAGPLHRLSGSYRFCNLLEQHGYASAEEVAATPEACWLELRNCGTRFIAAVRQALAGCARVTRRATLGLVLMPLPRFGQAVAAASGVAQRAPGSR
jgi:hypothetical protein